MTETTKTGMFAGEQRYRHLMSGFMLIGAVAFILSAIAWLIVESDLLLLGGTAIYGIGLLSSLVIWKTKSVALNDERDTRIEREASALTLSVIGLVMMFAIPTMPVFAATGVYELPPRLRGMFDGGIVLLLIFGLALVYYRSKRS